LAKSPKKPNFVWPFFKNEKSQKSSKNAKNYKFGLKKAELATLPSICSTHMPHKVQPRFKCVL